MAALVASALCLALGARAMAGKPPKTAPTNGPRVISYVRQGDWWNGPTPHELRIIDELGGGGVTILGALGIGRPQWSPDGSRLAYAKQFGDRWYDEAIMTIRPDGREEQTVVTLQEVDDAIVPDGGNKASYLTLGSRTNQPLEYFDDLVWSPTGQCIVFSARYYIYGTDPQGVVHYNLRRRLCTFDCETGAITMLTPESGGADDAHPHWSATLNKIVFLSDRSTRTSIHRTLWVINPDGTGMREIADPGGDYTLSPTWNHRGDQIAVSVGGEEEGPYDRDLWILDIGLTTEGEPYVTGRRILPGDPLDAETAPSWSPDDTQLLFSRAIRTKRGAIDQIVKLDLATLTETVLVSDKSKWLASPDWCPVVPAQ